MNTSRERLARRAAEMLRDGMAGSIPEAIGQARREPGGGSCPPPSIEQVRRHVDAMEMARLGLEAWAGNRRARLEEVDQFLATLEFYLDGVEMRIAGKCASGHIDEGSRVHIRAWVDGELDSVVKILDVDGMGPLEVGSQRVDPAVALGLRRLSTLLVKGEHVDFVISLCPVRDIVTIGRNLVTGSDIPLADIGQMRAMLERSS